jgi:hypothetical protein
MERRDYAAQRALQPGSRRVAQRGMIRTPGAMATRLAVINAG